MTEEKIVISDKNFEAMKALYDNKQQWVRHYEMLLGQINPISTTASLTLATFITEKGGPNNPQLFFVLVPIILIGFTFWFNWWCDKEIRSLFQQLILVEKGLGFFDLRVDGQEVLPSAYITSAIKTRPIIMSGYVLQGASLLFLAILTAAKFL
ncbi:MAG: hypothetical protein Q7J29_06705 [Stagnimonas sp.]|nr:hypothetical protein [Stagnimonas sp.]